MAPNGMTPTAREIAALGNERAIKELRQALENLERRIAKLEKKNDD